MTCQSDSQKENVAESKPCVSSLGKVDVSQARRKYKFEVHQLITN